MLAEPAGQNCQAGGSRIDFGLDNGDGGGTANDGVLSSGEIDQTSYLCPYDIPSPQVWLQFNSSTNNSVDGGLTTGTVATYQPDRCPFANAALFSMNTVSVPVSISGSVSYVAWVRTTSISTFSGLMAQPDPPTNGLFQLYLTGGTPVVEYFNQAPMPTDHSAIGTFNVSDDTWHLLVAVLDLEAKSVTIYVDGMPTASKTVPLNATLSFTGDLSVGRLRDIQGDFTGLLDDVRVYTVALTAQQVEQLYTNERIRCR